MIGSLTDKRPLIYSKDFYEWPHSWMGFDKDIATGEAILQGILPFVAYLIERGLAKRTIKNHMNNLWLLGSEIIRGVHDHKGHRKLSPEDLLLKYVTEDGGPWVHGWDPNDNTDESSCKSYDSTCRQLFRFLKMAK